MATEVIADPNFVVRLKSIRWSAIFAGAVAALATWALLYALGLAIGLSTVNMENVRNMKAPGLFTGIWGVLAPMAALFVGGFVAGRGAGVADRGGGALHGFVMWGLAILVGGWLFMSLIGSLAGGLASAGKAAVQVSGKAVSGVLGAAGGGGEGTFGIDANDALGPVNRRLEAEGKPAVTAEQLQASARDALRAGSLDRQTLVSSLAANTALSTRDAEDIASRVETQFQSFKSGASHKLQSGAVRAAEVSGLAVWGVFLSMILSLITALIGGALGVGRMQRVAARLPTEPTGYRPPLTPREVT